MGDCLGFRSNRSNRVQKQSGAPMAGSLSYDHSRSQKSYMAPTGMDPAVYMQHLSQEADAFCREGDLHAALRLLQKRLAVVSYYRGSRTVQAAQAMAKLASVTRQTGNEQDATTWAYYAFRAYATLMMNDEARHKQHMAESLAMLDQEYPGLSKGKSFACTGVPDFTSGKLLHSPKAVPDRESTAPMALETDHLPPGC
jgi:hypothetical protein